MVKKRELLWFFSLFGLYFFVRFLRTNWLQAPNFLKFYFTDLLFIPTMCLFALFFIRKLKRDNTIVISSALVFTQVVLVSVYFEWYLPNFQKHKHPYTGDAWDVVMYILGGIIFLWIQKKQLSVQ